MRLDRRERRRQIAAIPGKLIHNPAGCAGYDRDWRPTIVTSRRPVGLMRWPSAGVY